MTKAQLNHFQQLARDVYASGDFAHCETEAEIETAKSGDSLFAFVLSELADDGDDKMMQETADQRLRSAIEQLEDLRAALWHPTNVEAADDAGVL
jgi:hypothetical protein